MCSCGTLRGSLGSSLLAFFSFEVHVAEPSAGGIRGLSQLWHSFFRFIYVFVALRPPSPLSSATFFTMPSTRYAWLSLSLSLSCTRVCVTMVILTRIALLTTCTFPPVRRLSFSLSSCRFVLCCPVLLLSSSFWFVFMYLCFHPSPSRGSPMYPHRPPCQMDSAVLRAALLSSVAFTLAV